MRFFLKFVKLKQTRLDKTTINMFCYSNTIEISKYWTPDNAKINTGSIQRQIKP